MTQSHDEVEFSCLVCPDVMMRHRACVMHNFLSDPLLSSSPRLLPLCPCLSLSSAPSHLPLPSLSLSLPAPSISPCSLPVISSLVCLIYNPSHSCSSSLILSPAFSRPLPSLQMHDAVVVCFITRRASFYT